MVAKVRNKRPAVGTAPEALMKAMRERWPNDEDYYAYLIKRATTVLDPAGPAMLKEIVERVTPKFKATMPKVTFDFTDGANSADKILEIITAIANGELPPDVGQMLVNMIRAEMEVREITELADRLAAIEEKMGGQE